MYETYKKQLEEFEKKFPVTHLACDDCWYSCPLSEEGCCDESQKGCNCGAEKQHEIHKSFLKASTISLIQKLIEELEGRKKNPLASASDYYNQSLQETISYLKENLLLIEQDNG